MKKFFAISATVLAAIFVIAPGSAGSAIVDPLTFESGVGAAQAVDPTLDPPPNDGAHDFAVGGGQHDDFTGVCSNSDRNCTDEGFSAHSGPLGENPQGHISASSPSGSGFRGDVICLQVVGNEAYILAVENRSGDVIPQGTQFFLDVVDNGNPVDGTPPDLIRNSFTGFFTPPLPGFPCGLPILPPVPLVRGNIVVHNELP